MRHHLLLPALLALATWARPTASVVPGDGRDAAGVRPASVRRAALVSKVEHFYATAPDAERLFRVFRDSLGLAEAWAFRSYGDFASGGVSLGNVVFELASWKPEGGGTLPTELSGIALEPVGGTDALVAELARRSVRHAKPDTNFSTSASGQRLGWVNTLLVGMLPDPNSVFFCDYTERATVHAGRRRASDALAASGGGALGVVALRELVVGAPDTAAARAAWRRLLDGPAQEAGGVFRFGDGPRIRVVPAPGAGIVRMVLEVRSLARAREALAARRWLATAADGTTAIAPAAVGGLRVELVERAGPPPAPVRPVVDTLHGVVVTDPYRWMEDERAPEVQAWYRAQSAHAESALARIPGRDALAAEIERLLGQDTGLWGLWPTRGGVFTRRIPAGGDEPVLHLREHVREHVRDRAGGAERVLVDPARLVFGGKRYAVRSTAPSPDGRHVVLGIAADGDADPSLLVVDARTGAFRERIGPVLWGSGDGFTAAWLPDGSGFLYTANDATPATPETERWWRGRVRLHRVGTPRSADVAVFGHGLSARVPLRPEWTPFVHTGAAAGHVAVRVWHGGPVQEVWTAPVAALDGARTPWRRIVAAGEATEAVAVHGDGLLVITSDSAPRYRVVRHALGARGASGGTSTVLPEGEGVVVSMAPARDALYVVRRLGGGTRVVRVPWNGGAAREIALPFEGMARLATDPARDGAYVRLLSWIQPDRAYRYDPATGTLALAGLEPAPRFDPSPYVVEATHATARDGVRVPMTVVRRRDLPRDGARPVHLHGYGSFGTPVSTYFAPELKAWLDRGAIFAVAHVRGGGELGAAWHDAGRAARKPVAVADFVDAAEQLVRDGWTRAGRIGIEGASAGTFLVNNAIVDRPDLFGAAVSAVGVGDAVRVYHTAGGPRNVQEIGSLDDAAGVRSLLAVSALHRVRDGVRFPPTLFVSGATDYVLPLWQTGKLVARLQAAQGPEAPVLWHIDWRGGHGGASSNAVYARETALLNSFLLWRLGHPDFQPAAP